MSDKFEYIKNALSALPLFNIFSFDMGTSYQNYIEAVIDNRLQQARRKCEPSVVDYIMFMRKLKRDHAYSRMEANVFEYISTRIEDMDEFDYYQNKIINTHDVCKALKETNMEANYHNFEYPIE